VLDRGEGLDRLYFYHHQVFRQQIYAITEFEFHSAINDREAGLRYRSHPGYAWFMLQAGCRGAFQKTRTQFGMDFRGRGDDAVTGLLCDGSF
jgi:hypothetical protein